MSNTAAKSLNVKVVQITSLYDIKKVITPFMPHEVDNSVIKAKLDGVNGESGGRVTFELSAPTKCDTYSQFIEGMKSIKARVDTIAKIGESAARVLNVDGPSWIDNLIRTKLGGRREGARIRWDLGTDTYYFDPFTGQLSKCSSQPQT